jgi:hypothetical protein
VSSSGGALAALLRAAAGLSLPAALHPEAAN